MLQQVIFYMVGDRTMETEAQTTTAPLHLQLGTKVEIKGF